MLPGRIRIAPTHVVNGGPPFTRFDRKVDPFGGKWHRLESLCHTSGCREIAMLGVELLFRLSLFWCRLSLLFGGFLWWLLGAFLDGFRWFARWLFREFSGDFFRDFLGELFHEFFIDGHRIALLSDSWAFGNESSIHCGAANKPGQKCAIKAGQVWKLGNGG